ncbi:thioredoxin SoxW [Rhodovulum sp. P5]|uniref:thioredoxin family protein n=1 Tax=Rhodovulum sp. P5 TaxID=1564506 RepID=UPI0009C1AB55|nr:thioredoxin family protein [Rhodovulum sp. P5]ARE41573.1 thioredoxin SoxW [Rhodovulum sp. P5]
MLTRRHLLAGGAALALVRPAWAEAILGDDGLHKQDWFLDSFLELGDDLNTAAAGDKGLIVLFEQAGCPYCRELHRVNFARPEIRDYLIAHFDVVQLDMWGSRAVLDFDGEELEERALAAKWGVNFTPTTVLFPSVSAGAADRAAAEAFRLPGYLKPFHYLSALEYVSTGAYRDQPFQRFLQDKFATLRAQGIDPDVW